MIEQRAVAVLDRVQLAQEVGEQPDVVRLNLDQLLDLLRAVLVMRRRVMALVHVDHRIRLVALLARHHVREHARDVRLIGERHQVVHQLDVLFEVERDADRRRRQVESDLLFLAGHLDASLDLADALEVVVDRHAILAAEAALQIVDLLRDRVEDAAIFLASAPAARPALPPWPNIRSNTLRGLISIGIGVVGVRHDSVFM